MSEAAGAADIGGAVTEIATETMGSTSGSTPVERSTISDDLSAAFDEVSGTPAQASTENEETADLREDISRAAGVEPTKAPAETPKTYEDYAADAEYWREQEQHAINAGAYGMAADLNALRSQANLLTVQTFADAKNEKGELLHPHVHEVSKTLVGLLQAAEAEGRKMTLQEAYKAAVWADPRFRAEVRAAQEKAAPKKARKTPDNVGADLAAAFDAVSGRA